MNGWTAKIVNYDDEIIYDFMYSSNIPLPNIGDTILIPTKEYKGAELIVGNIIIDYEDRIINVMVEPK